MLVRSKPCSVSMRLAASRIAAPLARSFGRPGLAGLAGAVAAGLREGGGGLGEIFSKWFGIFRSIGALVASRWVFPWPCGALHHGPGFGLAPGGGRGRPAGKRAGWEIGWRSGVN